MKAGAEIHFLAGQIFTLGIAAVAVLPRMPSDPPDVCTVGGDLSRPFRRALLGLVAIGVVRVVAFHLHHHPESAVLRAADVALGALHVAGQSFLCLTTAYLLQRQLSTVINVDGGAPGRSLVPALAIVLVLTASGAVLSEAWHPNAWCLVNLAEACSCLPVLRTLRLYASVTSLGDGHHRGRGPVMTQILAVIERWYLITSLLSFVGEAVADDARDDLDDGDGARPLKILLRAIRHNQDNGVDDWTRLVLHSVFLNSVDELRHFSSSPSFANGGNENVGRSADPATMEDVEFIPERGALALRRREKA